MLHVGGYAPGNPTAKYCGQHNAVPNGFRAAKLKDDNAVESGSVEAHYGPGPALRTSQQMPLAGLVDGSLCHNL